MGSLTSQLECVECGRVADRFERGWRAYFTDEELEPRELATYCPLCAGDAAYRMRD
jgi:ribosomal protein L44E